jgi:zinc transport system permease protein
MGVELIFDPLFRVPFAVGLVMSAVLPLLGNLLRLRDEWLAALGLAYLAGASGLIGLAFGIPAVLGAPLGALAGAVGKSFAHFRGNTVYAMMVIVGWATTMLVASNSALGSVMGHALIEGQLYFAGALHLGAALVVGALSLLLLPLLMPALVRGRLMPGRDISHRQRAWRWSFGFDLLAALGMAVGAGTLGLMAAFALAFVPPWAAFRVARNWRDCRWISVGIAMLAYVVAFGFALVFDQPFGPVLVAVLVLMTGMVVTIRSY